MTRIKSRPHHRENISTEFEGYKMLWSSIENDENAVQRVPSPMDIPQGPHPVVPIDSGDDSRDGHSDDSSSNQMMPKIGSSISQRPDRRISSDNSLDEGRSCVRDLLKDLKPNSSDAQLAAILHSQNSPTPPSRVGSPRSAVEECSASRFRDDSSSPKRDFVETVKSSRVVETDDNAQQESAQQESFPGDAVNGHCDNGSSAENTRFSDLNLSPRSVQPLVELSDLTPLLGNSPQSPNRDELSQDVVTPVENGELAKDVPADSAEPETSTDPPIPVSLDMAEPVADGSEKSLHQVEPISDDCPPPTATLERPQDHQVTPGPGSSPDCISDPDGGHSKDVDAPGDPDSSSQVLRTSAVDNKDTQVRSPSPPQMHDDRLDVNKCDPDPMSLVQSEDDPTRGNEAPAPIPPPLSSTTTGRALNLLTAMLVANDDEDFSNFSCIERLGPDFDPSNVNFLTHSEINKEIFADQSSSSGDNTGKNSLFYLPASQSNQSIFDDDFPKCTNFLPTIIKVESDYKHEVRACFDDFLECIMEDSGVFTMTDVDKISSESDVDSIGDSSIGDSDSVDNDRCQGKCQVIVERLPSSLARTGHLSLSNKHYVAWRKNFARERNEELFQHLKVWRRGRILLWRECELAGMDRETYDRQVEYVKLHKIEVNCIASGSSDSEDVSIDSGILPTGQISSDSSDSELSLDFEMASVPVPSPVIKNILQKPRPKSKKLEFQNRQMSKENLMQQSPSKEEYVVEHNSVSESKGKDAVNPPAALKITIRKASITKSDDEIEGPVEREMSSDDEIVPLILPVAKKVRRVAMKRTTKRARTPVQKTELVPPIATSSTDDEFSLSPNKTSPEAIRRKKSYFVEENEDDEALLGRRADEVENHNLLERFEIPFEQPTLFRSPRMASKLAQLKNKEAFKSIIKHTKASKMDPILKDVKIVVEELVLKTVEAILTQPRSRSMALKKQPEHLKVEKNVESALHQPTKSESVDNFKTDKKPFNIVEPVAIKCEPIAKVDNTLAEVALRDKEAANCYPGGSAKELVTSTHQRSPALSEPKDSNRASKADSEIIVESSDTASSQVSNATPTTTCQEEIQAKESSQGDKAVQPRATRASQPNIEVDLDLIETLVGKKKKRLSAKKEPKITEQQNAPKTAEDSPKPDVWANEATSVSADDSVTTTSKTQPRKKRKRRISRFAKKPSKPKPLSEEIVRESDLEKEERFRLKDSSKSLVQVAEISEGQGSEHISDPSPAPCTPPEPQFTRRVLRSHPRAASLKSSLTVSENVDSDRKKADPSEEKMEPSSTDLPTSPSISSAVELSNTDAQPCNQNIQSANVSECPAEPSESLNVEVQPDKDQATNTEQPAAMEELPETSESLNLETEGDGELILDDWQSVGSPGNEVEKSDVEAAGDSSKNARDESSILFDALLASSFNKKVYSDQVKPSPTLKTDTAASLPTEKAPSSNLNEEKLEQPDEKGATVVTLPSSCEESVIPAREEESALDCSDVADSSIFPNFSIDQMTEFAQAMEANGGTDITAEDDAALENNRQSLLNSDEQIDFSSLSNILDMADSAEDLIIDQPFSDDEPEPDGIKDCINNLIQNHIDISDSPTKDKTESNPGAAKDSAKSQSKDGSIDERTGLPTTLIQRLRDPRIRSKVMSQLDGSEKVDLPQVLVQAIMQPVSDTPKTPIEPKDVAPKIVENQSRDPRALRSSKIVTRSCAESAHNAEPTIPIVGEQMNCVNQENASENVTADCLPKATEDSGQPAIADEDDEEEEALKRRPKKAKKTIDTELMYKSPLEDLEKEPLQSYSRAPPRRYPMKDPRPRSYAENRPSRWDMRNSVGKPGPQERHPEMVQMPPIRSQPLPLVPVAPPALHVHNQHNWMMDQNADCLPSYVEQPQWNWMNEQTYNRRNAWINSKIVALQREPKPSDPKTFAMRKPVLPYIRCSFKDVLPKPQFDLDSDDKEIVISMMDPYGQEIDMLQLPRPTAKVTKDYLMPACNYKLIEEMVDNPSVKLSRYMDEEKVDELVLDFFDEGDAAKIVRMQSHVPVKKSKLTEAEPSTDEDVIELKLDYSSDSLFDEVIDESKEESEKEPSKVEAAAESKLETVTELQFGIPPTNFAQKGEELKSKSSAEPVDESNAAQKLLQPTGKMEYLDIILNHLPILKEQYSFKTTPLKAPEDDSKHRLISGPSNQKPSVPDSPSSPSPPVDIKNVTPLKNPSPPRIMKALLNLTKSEKRCPRRRLSRSKSRSPPPRKKSESPVEYRSRRHRHSPRRSPASRRKRSRSPDGQRRTSFRHGSPLGHVRRRLSKETSSGSSTPRYSRSSRSPSHSPSSRRRYRRAPSVSSSRSTTPLPKAYRRSWTRSPSVSYHSRSTSKSPPRKRYSRH